MSKRALGAVLIMAVCLSGCKVLVRQYYFNKGNTFFRDNKFDRAIVMYEKALEADPECTKAYFYLGSSYLSLFKPGVNDEKNKTRAKKAVDAFTKVLEKEPNNIDALLSLADLYDKDGNFGEALKYYKKRIANNPNDPTGYYVMAEFYRRHGKNEEAAKVYEQRIALDPQNPEGYLYLARFYGDMSPPDFDKSIEAHRRRIALLTDPKELKEAYYSIGVTAWAKSFRRIDLTVEDRKATLQTGYEALDKAIGIDATYPEPVIYKSLLLREEAKKVAMNDRKRMAELEAEADSLKEEYIALKKKQKEAQAASAEPAAQ